MRADTDLVHTAARRRVHRRTRPAAVRGGGERGADARPGGPTGTSPATIGIHPVTACAQVGKPVTLELRYDALEGGAREDRAHNAQARLDAFAGRPVTKRARPCVAAGVDSPGLACTLVEFAGPVGRTSPDRAAHTRTARARRPVSQKPVVSSMHSLNRSRRSRSSTRCALRRVPPPPARRHRSSTQSATHGPKTKSRGGAGDCWRVTVGV